MMRTTLTLAALLALPPFLAGQQRGPSLDALQQAALRTDPRAGQRTLLEGATHERLASLGSERLPQFRINAAATWQSDVTTVTLGTAGGPPPPPRDRWQATVAADQLLYDGGGIAARSGIERARLAEQLEGVTVAQYQRRAEVNAAFFSAWLAQQRAAGLEAVITDLDARVAQARVRVDAGTALPADTARLVASRLDAELQRDAALARRQASLAELALLTGYAVGDLDALALPDLAEPVVAARATPPAARRDRPEFAQLAASKTRLDREIAFASVENRPRLVAFSETGVGRPGLNQFATGADLFTTFGVRLEWRPWTWHRSARTGATLRRQQEILATEEAALADAIARLVQFDLAEIDRLAGTLARDEQLVALRRQVEATARIQFDEGTITAADYVDARTDLLTATIDRDRRRAELAQAEARYLTTLGLPPR